MGADFETVYWLDQGQQWMVDLFSQSADPGQAACSHAAGAVWSRFANELRLYLQIFHHILCLRVEVSHSGSP
jgi:hypothetical protein